MARLPSNPNIRTVQPELLRLLRDICNQVNAISEGNAHAHHAAMTTAPTTGSWSTGDQVKNSAPALGKYAGWVYVASSFIGYGQLGALKNTTANRPTKTTLGVVNDADWAGYLYFDTTLDVDGKPIWWTGTAWVDATGATV